MTKTWRCGDCRTEWPMSVTRCRKPFDDYLSLRGGSVESAIQRSVGKSIDPLIRGALRRLDRRLVRGRQQWKPAPDNPVVVVATFAIAA